MTHTVFVYGTLLSEEIVKILLNRNPESHAGMLSVLLRSVLQSGIQALVRSAATVKGFSRYRIRGRVYPAILPTLPMDELTGMVCAHSPSITSLPTPCGRSLLLHS